MGISLIDMNISFITPHGRVDAVRKITTRFEEGKITGIIGESGSGKSVMGMGILGLLPDNTRISGRCDFYNKNLLDLREKELEDIRGKEIGLIPQNPVESLSPMYPIDQQVSESPIHHKILERKEKTSFVNNMLKKFGFTKSESIDKKYPFQLSGGMCQRIVSATGISSGPAWLIADEPTKALDSIMRNQVYNILYNIYKEGHSLILITHDMFLAQKLCHEIKVMYGGEIIEQGSSHEIFNNPQHPYTIGLIDALPENGMKAIPFAEGDQADKLLKDSDCVFYARCNMDLPRCRQTNMKDFLAPNESLVRCYRYD